MYHHHRLHSVPTFALAHFGGAGTQSACGADLLLNATQSSCMLSAQHTSAACCRVSFCSAQMQALQRRRMR